MGNICKLKTLAFTQSLNGIIETQYYLFKQYTNHNVACSFCSFKITVRLNVKISQVHVVRKVRFNQTCLVRRSTPKEIEVEFFFIIFLL